MSRHKREVIRVEPGQVAIIETDHPVTRQQAFAFRDEARKAGLEHVLVLSQARIVGVCNVRPWKRAR